MILILNYYVVNREKIKEWETCWKIEEKYFKFGESWVAIEFGAVDSRFWYGNYAITSRELFHVILCD